ARRRRIGRTDARARPWIVEQHPLGRERRRTALYQPTRQRTLPARSNARSRIVPRSRSRSEARRRRDEGGGEDEQMAYRDRVLARIQRYTAADLTDVVAFRRKVYGPDAFFSRPDYVRWMYGEDSTPACGPSPLWLY